MPSVEINSSAFNAAPGVSLYFETSGNRESGKDILFVHGLGASTRNWSDVRSHFERAHRVTLLDLKGPGCSSRPRDGDYSLDQQAGLLLAFLANHFSEAPLIIAHSYGGAVVLLALVKQHREGRPLSASGLVLVDVPAYPQPLPFFLKALHNPILNRIVSFLPARVQVEFRLKKSFFDHSKLTPTIIDRYVDVMKAPNSHYALALAARQMMPPDIDLYLEGIRRLEVPTLLVWGQNDTVVPLRTAQRLQSDLKTCVLEVINSCGHVPQQERPEEFIRVVQEYLDKVR